MHNLIAIAVMLVLVGCASTSETAKNEEVSGPGACAALHEHHEHVHGPKCGHPAITHNDHKDYTHDGHTHCPHTGHYDEIGTINAKK